MSDSGRSLRVASPDTNGGSRGVARLPERVRHELEALSGDTIIVTGDRPVTATVWPGDATLESDAIRLDEWTLERTGVAVGESVAVRREPVDDATTVTIAADDDVNPQQIRDALQAWPLSTGDQLRLGDVPVRIRETRPDGTVRVTEATRIHVEQPAASDRPIDVQSETEYADIGGLDAAVERVRETVEYPLHDPETFEQLGIDPPTGVLLYGPPGTGKTLLAEAVANAVDARFYHVSGPEITSKYKGESEERLRELFARARESAPSILFFDEIDALASEREGSDMETRIVAQLLSLMDGLEARGNVVVLGATNRIDAIDPALRRPGRFDREIEIGVPTQAGREEILAIHTDDVPLAPDVDLNDLAARTHGFVGADIQALVTEAAMTALRTSEGTPRVTREDFETALAGIEPSAMREFVAETPSIGLDDVGGLAGAKSTLREAVQWPLEYPDLFDATNTDPPSGILLFGPPGTGKTRLGRALAGETEVNFIHVAGPELIDKYVGESEKAVREVFDRARQAAPAIVFFDEIDAIAARRDQADDVTDRVVSQLLTELDGLTDTANVMVLAATNRKDILDPALLRPGRLETHIEVPVPDEQERYDILKIHTRGKPLAADVDLNHLASSLDGATGAEIAALVREASMRAIRDVVSTTQAPDGAKQPEEVRITMAHFDAAQAQVLPVDQTTR